MTTQQPLSKIKEIDLRDQWKNEAADFTPWLAQQENLDQLADALGIAHFEDVEREVAVGTFSADICCVDRSSGSDKKVIIENQLEVSNHSHLGQILTYAAGREASIIIWVAPRFRERHRAAIDWLNRHIDKDISFFAVEIHLIKIDDSKAAPLFKVVAMPDKWRQDVEQGERAMKELDPEHLGYYKFWVAFKEYMEGHPSDLIHLQNPAGKREANIHIGTGKAKIRLRILPNGNKVAVELYLDKDEDKALFDSLEQDKANIEKEFGALQWNRKDGAKIGTLTLVHPTLNYDKNEQWDTIFAWYREQTEKFIRFFQPRVRDKK